MSAKKPLVPGNIENLKAYVAGKTIDEVREIYQPERISKLASNENRLGCSSAVQPAVIEALKQIQDYPDPIARKLRKKLAELNGCDADELILAHGSESVISIICRTFFLDGQNAVTANATFVGFFVQAGVRGAEIKKVPLDEEYRFNVDALLDAVDSRTRMVYLANPNNPTGTYITDAELRRLTDELPEKLILINDEAYFEYTGKLTDYPSFTSGESRPSNMITLRTFSKAYGLAGFRIGYGMADKELIAEMMKAKLTFEPTAPAQAAALAALEDQDFIKKSLEVVEEGRERLYSLFDQYGVRYVPSACNSVLMLLGSEDEASEFTGKMLENGVILRQMKAFGVPNGIRITIGTREDMDHFERNFKKIYA